MSSLADALKIQETDSVVDPQLLEVSKQMLDGQPGFDVQNHTGDGLKLDIPNNVEGEEMADLFGDEDADAVVRESGVASPLGSDDGLSASERQHRKELEYEEDEGGDEAVVELKHAVLSIPNIPAPSSSDGESWVIRMPNFVKLDPKPFHPDTYVGPDQGDDDNQQLDALKERSMSIKLEVENTIRWRWTKDSLGQSRRQSNSRIIRWSDGSLSLLLGKELFDLNQTVDNSANLSRQQSSSQQLPSSQNASGVKSHGLTYLVSQHKRPGILQVEAPITGYMSVRPTGMQSETHRKLVRAVGQKHNKIARLRMVPEPITDPEREKMELMKQAAKKGKRTREDDGFGPRRRRSFTSRRRVSESVWSDDEEPTAGFDASEDEDDDDLRGNRKTKRDQGANKAGTGDYQTDDFVVADSSDEGEGSESNGRSRKRRRSPGDQEDQGPMDDLEEADAKIEQQERERRRTQQQVDEEPAHDIVPPAKSEVQEMDIESEEEDEEEIKVRRAGTGSRKKRAISMDDEEE